MKLLFSAFILMLHLNAMSQNFVYLEKLNNYSDFALGSGQVEVHPVGVSPSLDLYVKYNHWVGGTSVSTGWISHNGATYSDVYGTGFSVIGVYSTTGDTLIKSHQEFSNGNYEVANVTTSGFDAYGQLDLLTSLPWEMVITFSGPNMNCDAILQGFFPPISCSNNVLTLNQTSLSFAFITNPIYFNGQSSFNSLYFVDTIAYENSYPTGNLLNAYIPRVTTRPATAIDCNGVIDFERLDMVADIGLEFAINSDVFSPLLTDQLTGLCAFDTINVIGFSPTVLPGDTLVATSYILRSADNMGSQTYIDIANVDLDLNVGNTSPTNCTNKIDFNLYQGSTNGYSGLVFNENGEYIWVDFSWITGLENMCQGKYEFVSIDDNENLVGNFSFTIFDDMNQLHDFLYSLEFESTYNDTLACSTNLMVSRPTGPIVSSYLNKIEYAISGNQFVQVGSTNSTSFSSSQNYNNLCSGLYLFETGQKSKYVIITDSMQELSLSYREITTNDMNGNGYEDHYSIVPDVDSVLLRYEECTNDYTQPFNSILYNMTVPQNVVLTVGGGSSSTYILFDKFESSFDLTQNGNAINLHAREVLIPSYDYPQNQYPYYIIAELYCLDSTAKMSTFFNRRRIEIEPNGTIHDLYGSFLSVDDDLADYSKENKLIVFPNPTESSFWVRNTGEWKTLNVITLDGKTVQSINFDVNVSNLNVDLTNLSSGTYMIEVYGNGTREHEIIVKK